LNQEFNRRAGELKKAIFTIEWDIALNSYLKEILMKLKKGMRPEDYISTKKEGRKIKRINEAF